MSNNVVPVVPNKQLEILKLIEAKELTVEEGLHYLQSEQTPTTPKAAPSPAEPQQSRPANTRPAKVLRVKVIDGDHTKVSVMLPLGLVKWTARTLQTTLNALAPAILPHALARLAKEVNPQSADKIQQNLDELDFEAICNAIIEGIDQLEGVGQFDFVTVEDGDTKVQIGIE